MLMRTDPFRDLDRFAQDLFGTQTRPAPVPIDAFRRGDDFVIQLDIPGVRAEDFDLTVERNVLTIHAHREREAADDGVELIIGERPHGTFSRQLFLGETLDAERLAAEYHDGVLTVRLPVKEQAKPRRVEVRTGQQSTPIETRETAAEPIGASSS